MQFAKISQIFVEILLARKKKEIDDEKAWPWQFECPEFFVRAKQREATRVKFQRQNLSAPTYSPHFTFFFRALNEALARVCPPEDDSASPVLFPCFFFLGGGLSLSLIFEKKRQKKGGVFLPPFFFSFLSLTHK